MPMDDNGEWKELADDLMPDFSGVNIIGKTESEESSAVDEYSCGTSHNNGREHRMDMLGRLLRHPVEFTCL